MEEENTKLELPNKLLDFMSSIELLVEGAQLKRMGSYKILQLAEGVAINKAQLRSLMDNGLIAVSPANLKIDLIFSQNAF